MGQYFKGLRNVALFVSFEKLSECLFTHYFDWLITLELEAKVD